jgi:hypothetical protein
VGLEGLSLWQGVRQRVKLVGRMTREEYRGGKGGQKVGLPLLLLRLDVRILEECEGGGKQGEQVYYVGGGGLS